MLKKDVIEYFGGTMKTAEKLNIKHPAVSKWGKHIPELRAYQIEKLTGGQLKAGDYSKIQNGV